MSPPQGVELRYDFQPVVLFIDAEFEDWRAEVAVADDAEFARAAIEEHALGGDGMGVVLFVDDLAVEILVCPEAGDARVVGVDVLGQFVERHGRAGIDFRSPRDAAAESAGHGETQPNRGAGGHSNSPVRISPSWP